LIIWEPRLSTLRTAPDTLGGWWGGGGWLVKSLITGPTLVHTYSAGEARDSCKSQDLLFVKIVWLCVTNTKEQP
jgi:hypothetical protein